MSAARVTTRRAAVKRPREHDTGHVLIGVGHYFECSCGATGDREKTYFAAMMAGRDHAAEHTNGTWTRGGGS